MDCLGCRIVGLNSFMARSAQILLITYTRHPRLPVVQLLLQTITKKGYATLQYLMEAAGTQKKDLHVFPT